MVPRNLEAGKPPLLDRIPLAQSATAHSRSNESRRVPVCPPMNTSAPRAALVALMVLLVACGGPVAASPAFHPTLPPSVQPSPSAAEPSVRPGPIAEDLAHLLANLERSHPEPFHGVSREEFVAALDAYEAELPGLTPDEAVVGLMRVWAMLSRGGRDGHQFAFPTQEYAGPVLPIRIYEFTEGVFVTAALPPHEALAGARITAIAGTPIDDVLAAVEPLVPRDGPSTVPSFRPILLLRVQVLRGLGIIGEGPVTLALELPDGTATAVELDPVAHDAFTEWAGPFGMNQLPRDERVRYLADAEPFSATLLDGGTLYLRYRFIRPIGTSEVRDLLEGGSMSRVIVDIRQNPGGDNSTFLILRDLLVAFAEAHPGATTVLTDRVTFSAASNFATELERRTDARFVGEPMGGGLNFWDDVRWLELPNVPVPMRAAISIRHWVFSDPDDPRLTIEPDVTVEVSAADYFAGRDPALEAALGGD